MWAQATQTISLSWINLSCIPCTSPAAVGCSYYIASWHGKLATVSRHIFLSLSLLSLEIKKIQMVSKIITSWTPFSQRKKRLDKLAQKLCPTISYTAVQPCCSTTVLTWQVRTYFSANTAVNFQYGVCHFTHF